MKYKKIVPKKRCWYCGKRAITRDLTKIYIYVGYESGKFSPMEKWCCEECNKTRRCMNASTVPAENIMYFGGEGIQE